MTATKLGRSESLGTIKLDIPAESWERLQHVASADKNPDVPRLWSEVLSLGTNNPPPKITRNLTPSLVLSLAIAKAISMRAWKNIPGWSWQVASKSNSQHNVHLEAMRVEGAPHFSTGLEFKEWLRSQCGGYSANQILPLGEELTMGRFVVTCAHYLDEILGTVESDPDRISFSITIHRDRARALTNHLGARCDDDDLAGALAAALRLAKF